MPLVNKTFDQLLDFTRTTAATFVNSEGRIQTTVASRNLLTQTQQFDNAAWGKTAITATANSAVAPDGTSTADTLTDTAVTSNHYTAQTISTVSGTTYTLSAYFKNNGRGFVILNLANLSGATNYAAASFNLSTGAVANTLSNGTGYSVVSTSITSVGDGWYRCAITAVVGTTTATTASVALSTAGTIGPFGLDSYLGNGSGIYVWGAQLETVPDANLVLGSEVVTNGDFSGGSTGWTAASGWAIGSGVATATATNASLVSTSAVTVGRVYRVAFDVTSYTGGTLSVRVGAGAAQTVNSAGSKVLYLTASSTAGVEFYGGGITLSLDNVSVREITGTVGMPSTYTRNNGGVFPPRFDYDPVTLAPKGLLVEEQRTNLILQSETFDSATWNKFNATVTANATVSPDGVADADALVADANTSAHFVQQFLSYTSGVAYTFSTYVKAGTRAWASMSLPSAAFTAAQGGFFNLSGAGSLGTTTGAPTSRTITAVGNGWYRLTVTATATATAGGNAVIAAASADGTSSYAGTNGATALSLYGAQLEAGAFATSYIPTVASQVTRTADQTSIVAPNFAPWYNQSEGTFVFEGTVLGATGFSWPVVASDNTAANRLGMYRSGIAVAGFIIASNVTQMEVATTSVVANVPFKIGVTAQANSGNFSFNGNIASTDTTITMPVVNKISLGSSASGTSEYLNGHIRSIRYYPVRLSNTQLQALTA